MTEPSNRVMDNFRSKNFGKIDAPANSKPATDSFHVDHSRLGVHEEYDCEAPNDWGGKGKFVERPNSIMDQTRASVGDIRRQGSYRDLNAPATPTGIDCCPSPYPPARMNPLTSRRGN